MGAGKDLRSYNEKVNSVLKKDFHEAMGILSTTMWHLSLEAELLLAKLEQLEGDMAAIYQLVTQENLIISEERMELLSELWTILGGNRRKLRQHDNHLDLLKNMGEYRKKALVHVITAIHTLEAMEADIKDVREKAIAGQSMESRISTYMQVKSIESGVRSLTMQREKGENQ